MWLDWLGFVSFLFADLCFLEGGQKKSWMVAISWRSEAETLRQNHRKTWFQELFRTRLVRLNVVHFNVVAASCPWSTASWLLAEAAHLGVST